jgi:hydrophobe/amphiphile efflux-3 (HAE3) family protein
MKRLMLWVLEHPALTVGGALLLTAFFAFQVPRVKIDPSGEGLMLEKAPARDYYEKVKQKFGADTQTIVVIKADDVFAPPVLRAVQRISDALEKTEGVTRVESLTTVKNIKGEGNTLNTDPLVERQIPTAEADLRRIRQDALSHPVFIKNIVSPDGKATGVIAYTDSKGKGEQYHQRVVERVDALIQAVSAPGLTLYQIGNSLQKATYWEYMKADQLTLIPLSLGVLFLTLFLGFRTPQGVAIPMVTGIVSLAWAVGLMTLTGLPLNALTAIVPSMLIAIGFTEDTHMISEYHRLVAQGKERSAAVREMLEQTALPMLITTVTTALGFMTLVLTNITMLIQFGWAAAMGITANFVVTMILMPFMLRVWPVPRRFRTAAFKDESTQGVIPRLMDWLAGRILRHRLAIVAATGLILVGSLVSWYNVRVDTDYLSFFPERSIIRQRAKDIHNSLAGIVPFYIVIETGREDGVKDPELLRKIVALQEWLVKTGKVDKTISLADYLRKMHREMNGGDPRFEVIPDTLEEVAQYLLTLEGNELSKYVDFNASTANVLVRHNLSSSWMFSELRKPLEEYLAKAFPQPVTVRLTGESILVNDASDFMAINEFTSFGTILFIIGLIHAGLFFSLRAGFLSLIPNVIPIVTNFGVMGLLGIPLNTGTAVVATIAIGIAVDDTVHHMVTYSRELNEHHDPVIAMRRTMQSQGRPIIYVSLALAAGFFVLSFSNFVPIAQMGLLSGIVILVAMVGEMVLTPLLMVSTRLATLWDMVMLKMDPDVVRSAPLLHGLNRWEARKVVLLGVLKSLEPGEYAVRKGETGTAMYMVVSGHLRASDVGADGRERTLSHLTPGMVFGEVALVGEGTRIAHVIAESPSEVLALDFKSLEGIRKRFPFTGAKLFRNVAAILGERLKDTTAALMRTGIPAAP